MGSAHYLGYNSSQSLHISHIDWSKLVKEPFLIFSFVEKNVFIVCTLMVTWKIYMCIYIKDSTVKVNKIFCLSFCLSDNDTIKSMSNGAILQMIYVLYPKGLVYTLYNQPSYTFFRHIKCCSSTLYICVVRALSLACPVFVWGPPGLLADGSCCLVIWGLRSSDAAFPCWSCLSYFTLFERYLCGTNTLFD
jgi:hypothetical protein